MFAQAFWMALRWETKPLYEATPMRATTTMTARMMIRANTDVSFGAGDWLRD